MASSLSNPGEAADGRRRRQWLRRCIVFLAGSAFLVTCLCWLGAYGFIGPAITCYSLLASAGLAVGWVVMAAVALIIRRNTFRTHWRALLAGTAICLGGFALVFYSLVIYPVRNLSPDGPPAELRSLCHRCLVSSTDLHDAFLCLARVGDETSVPYLLWSFRSMPNIEEGHVCTWDHGIKALSIITNHHPEKTREAWAQWYEAHKTKTMVEWWAEGFAAEGYQVSLSGGEQSIGSLLEVLGRRLYHTENDKFWLEANAKRMLTRYDQQKVGQAIRGVITMGTVGQRRGAARYARDEMPEAEAQVILRELSQDADGSVRAWATP